MQSNQHRIHRGMKYEENTSFPGTLVSPAVLVHFALETPHVISINQVWFQWDFNFLIDANFTCSGYLTTWPLMTFDLVKWPLTSSTNKAPHVVSINQVWFQSDFNFSVEVNFTFLGYLRTWPLMTFDLGMWPLTSSTNEAFHVTSINQVWSQLNFNFSIEANFPIFSKC